MSRRYRIGDLARAADVPVSTLRYYERVGLLEAHYRTESNYRVYGQDAVERVRFIREAQGAGFSLDDVVSLLNVQSKGDFSCCSVELLIEQRLADVESRIRDLSNVQRRLEELRSLCRESAEKANCPAIDRIAADSSSY